MNIKTRLILLGLVSILGVATILGVSTFSTKNISELGQARTQLSDLQVSLLMLRRNEKDFLLRKDLKYLDKFGKNADNFLSINARIASTLAKYDIPYPDQLVADLDFYKNSFTKMVNAYKTLGLKEGEGLMGAYLAAYQSVFDGANNTDKITLDTFHESVLQGNYDPTLLGNLGNAELKSTAQNVVKQLEVIGLKYNVGMLGGVRGASHKIEKQFKASAEILQTGVSKYEEQIVTIKWGITLVVIIIIIAVVAQISVSINSMMNKLLTTIQEISETNNIGMRVDINGKSELSELGKYFNQLLDSIEKLVSGSQVKSKALFGSTESMHTQLQGVIEQFDTQAQHTGSMATAVQEMVSTISEISESTAVAAEGVNQAANNAKAGRDVVSSTVDNINSLSGTLANSQASISSLNQHVDQIGGAVVMIQEIAEQTNLLALNAAIEAARAGEQGRGFAVVADEVRALASRTHQSTEEITSVVSAIQAQMSTVVSDIETCNSQGDQTKQYSQTLDDSFTQIISDMDSIQSNSERIASAIEEQGIVMNQVSESITELQSISDNNIHSAKQCMEEVDGVSSQAHDMDEAVAQFKTS
ncbi:putative Methyl-accepting chemotaxis protein [Vibrio nigripulchritudo SFn27]|uniref:Putative Methyl-accepting chemotaxis protein n=1 Tax=Vibrio nigripulchritudo TaxID=28173 RepID=U4KD11_9VIBR|nr:methyl-accepting chemotaxis protein [Vibrio nigripulchritudo]CCN69214.1 putative Methyl-accepting chemotaxis protein [Vibrio nigripulchritudo SFn118]CCN82106.1 putative Methyl-accepting chemotaxis protein [Vibrio nigripulchritudo BLFn1]CCN86438.1 putative Methyl-accepting chemotaxis protein [Vibrio nigripulchritudo SFn27]CCN96749.1 putative Methyl-accepting chemotaxis protein [Vibrio nigripulchritudo ENn2]CCO40277.1 putative Methyl-accepting chemotaxis protein [Vibrio nigripulchritudo SFn13